MADEIDPEGLGFLVTEIARLYRAEIDRRISHSGLDMTAGEGRSSCTPPPTGRCARTFLPTGWAWKR